MGWWEFSKVESFSSQKIGVFVPTLSWVLYSIETMHANLLSTHQVGNLLIVLFFFFYWVVMYIMWYSLDEILILVISLLLTFGKSNPWGHWCYSLISSTILSKFFLKRCMIRYSQLRNSAHLISKLWETYSFSYLEARGRRVSWAQGCKSSQNHIMRPHVKN